MIWRRAMLKFGSWKKKDKWLFLLTLGVIICILALPMGGKESGWGAAAASMKKAGAGGSEVTESSAGQTLPDQPLPAAARVTDSYEQELEARVREILQHVEGVGAVDVMIVLKTSGEKIIHVDGSTSRSVTEEQDTGGGTRKIESDEQTQSTVLTSANGADSPIVEKELRPEISGIIVSAEGGGRPAVCAEISAAMEALFDLPPHKIKVLKRVE
ncbi:MAG: stage III sporulation protein AG [Lachnospiraceae bacterium]|nr:stage III sporulation protein AG [Lachnospiraceae bacterium]